MKEKERYLVFKSALIEQTSVKPKQVSTEFDPIIKLNKKKEFKLHLSLNRLLFKWYIFSAEAN
jgi:hypothetical protein